MKISEKIIRFGLIVLITLSLYFSYMIWIGSSNTKKTTTDEELLVSNNTQNYKTMSDLFVPMSLTWINQDKVQKTNSETLIKQVQQLISAADYRRLSIEKFADDTAFSAALPIKNGIELSYYSPYLLNDYLETNELSLGLSDNDGENLTFSKVQFDFEQQKIRFINYQDKKIAESKMTWDTAEVETTLKNSQVGWAEMMAEPLLNEEQYLTKEPIRLKKYSYYSSIQSQSLLREAFFTSPKDVKINDESSDIYYYEGNQNMTVNQTDQLVRFESNLASTEEKDVFQQSAEYIGKLGNNLGNFRFFDRSDSELSYRVFVEGYPVFSNGSQGLITVNIANNGEMGSRELTILASLNAIQVPIPSETEVELPSSASVQTTLLEKGADPKLLQLIIIGYHWEEIKGASLVDLTPAWYVKYDGNWYTNQELLDKLAETEEK